MTPIDGAFRIEMQSLFDTGVLDFITLMYDSVILRDPALTDSIQESYSGTIWENSSLVTYWIS